MGFLMEGNGGYVIPAHAGIQKFCPEPVVLDSGVRRNDKPSAGCA
jgi:hypothetical protein